MPSPPLVHYSSQADYRAHFERVYCHDPILTFDGIPVRFRKHQFDHCMFESSQRNDVKDMFSTVRSQRIDWIKATLENPNADLYCGWDNKQKKPDPQRRVAVVYQDFVVIIAIYVDKASAQKADFVTAYAADTSIAKIRANPKWTMETKKRKCR